MAKSPYVFAAQPNTTALVASVDKEKRTVTMTGHPIVGWEVSGTWAEPLLPYGGLTVAAIEFERHGRVCDLATKTFWDSLDDWKTFFLTSAFDDAEDPAKPENSGVPAKSAEAPGITSREIDDIGLSGRAVAPLKREDIGTVSDFAEYSSIEISSIKGVSVQALKDIRAAMEIEGVFFNDEAPSSKPVSEPTSEDDFSDML